MWTGKLPRHGTCMCHFCIWMSLCDSTGFKVLSTLKFSINSSNSILMVRISLFNGFGFTHPPKNFHMSRCSKIFTMFSQPGWFNFRGYFKVYYWCFRDINACMEMSFCWCFNIIFGKRNPTLHPASVINVIPHLEFCTWTKFFPVNLFHSSKFGAEIIMKTF